MSFGAPGMKTHLMLFASRLCFFWFLAGCWPVSYVRLSFLWVVFYHIFMEKYQIHYKSLGLIFTGLRFLDFTGLRFIDKISIVGIDIYSHPRPLVDHVVLISFLAGYLLSLLLTEGKYVQNVNPNMCKLY